MKIKRKVSARKKLENYETRLSERLELASLIVSNIEETNKYNDIKLRLSCWLPTLYERTERNIGAVLSQEITDPFIYIGRRSDRDLTPEEINLEKDPAFDVLVNLRREIRELDAYRDKVAGSFSMEYSQMAKGDRHIYSNLKIFEIPILASRFIQRKMKEGEYNRILEERHPDIVRIKDGIERLRKYKEIVNNLELEASKSRPN